MAHTPTILGSRQFFLDTVEVQVVLNRRYRAQSPLQSLLGWPFFFSRGGGGGGSSPGPSSVVPDLLDFLLVVGWCTLRVQYTNRIRTLGFHKGIHSYGLGRVLHV